MRSVVSKYLAHVLLGLSCTLAVAPLCAQQPASPLIMGIFPRRNVQVTTQMFTPLARYLSRKLQRPVHLETSYDFASFWEQVKRQRYDLVHYNQYHYLLSHKALGYRVIAKNQEFGSSTIAGAIVVRKDSGIHTLQQLRGKKIVFGGDRLAMQSYISATYLLRQAGLKQGDYFEQFALNPPKAAIAAYYRQASAAGTGNHVLALPQVRKEIGQDQMEYLAKSQPIAQLPWAVKAGMPPQLTKQITNLLTGLHRTAEGKKLLQDMRVSNILPASDSDYDSARRIIKAVLHEDL
jgi:phosphonate transport system substrate-binding protein